MSLLANVRGPEDLRRVPAEDLPALATEIRDFLVAAVSRTGGHLGPNLGAVELTIALHRVFSSPRDRLLWDTGHQAYVHKILTGRQEGFDRLRQSGGLSGYPSRAESVHDVIENSHASTALSYADGLAKAFALRGESDRAVVAIVGDGALTGGMCWEALNNIAAARERPVIIVVNDNGRSYAPTIGGLADHLATLRLNPGYEQALEAVRTILTRTPVVGEPLFDVLHGLKRGLKDLVSPQILFEDLGLKYLGPVDGHDVAAVESALRRARGLGQPVIVHVVTRKGFGYAPAEADDTDCLHGPGPFEPGSGRERKADTGPSFTAVFGEEMLALGAEDPRVVAITAAMLAPVGLAGFAQAYPDRVFDVGIAEQHAVTSAAGLATGGMRPVVALYATFLTRAMDQVLFDVALHRLPVVFALDRAGITGPDGPSHHGMWDLSLLGVVPGLAIAAPRDAATLRLCLREALERTEGPSVVRYPKGPTGEDLEVIESRGCVDVLAASGGADVLVVSVGPLARVGLEVLGRLADQGITGTAVDPRWVNPLPAELLELARSHRVAAVLEDGVATGGVGERLAAALRGGGQAERPASGGAGPEVLVFGLPTRFLPHGSREELLRAGGLSSQEVARRVVEAVATGNVQENAEGGHGATAGMSERGGAGESGGAEAH